MPDHDPAVPDLNKITGAFAVYRLPGKSEVVLMSGSVTPLQNFDSFPFKNEGFILAPFAENQPVLWLEAEQVSEYKTEDIPVGLISSYPQHPLKDYDSEIISEKDYKNQVKKITTLIRNGISGKVVLSRRIIIPLPTDFNAMQLFRLLCNLYRDAFVYLVYVPGATLWAGASPETFLRSHGNKLSTMALAGTRSSDVTGEWGKKDKEEHAFVVDFIYEKLKTSGCKTIDKSESYTANAGKVAHLRTDFEAVCDTEKIPEIVKLLHPTPAVCGWPSDQALEIIRDTEKHDREYYTGYLGPVGPDSADLFVNLRCMQIFADKAIIYTGGGLTADSDPGSEWDETVLKSTTLLSAIEKMRNLAD
jgi:isochorismate synthase